MGIQFNKNRCRQPKIYIRNNKKYFEDPIRKKLIYVTPEEVIRQKVLKILLENGIPENMIETEICLSSYGMNSKRRADIVINYMSGNDCYPLAVIECKAHYMELDDGQEQAFEYADLIGADYVTVTNGKENLYFHYNQDFDIYESIFELPYYEDMICGKYTLKRIPFDKLETKGYIYIGNEIGKSTSSDLQTAMVNLLECLSDEKYTFPVRQYQYFRLIKDIGAKRSKSEGLYRSFLIECEGIEQIVSVGISACYTNLKQDIQKTAINILIDGHNTLQIIIDDNIGKINNNFIFCHINNITSQKDDEEKLKIFIKYNCPDIIKNDKVYLGRLKNDFLWHLSDTQVIALVENLISYALIRDKYRNYIKSENK